MEHFMSQVALWCLAVGLLVAVVLLLRERHVASRLRRRNATLEAEEYIRDEEVRHLVTTRIPALVEFLYDRPVAVPGLLHRQLSCTAYDRGLRAVMSMFSESMDTAKSRADQAAKATLKTMMRGVQSLASEQQLAISDMQERHDDPDVLEDLLRIDHMNSQLGRRAQATAVLCGSWPGQQRSDSSLIDVVRGATSRIRDYLRVEVHSQVNMGVVSRVVEPVVLAVAELLDNAARHSPPNTKVQVNFQATHNGLAIVIDDAGVAMEPKETEWATLLLSGHQSIDINRLGDPPQIGFAVVGVLAARYGFSVSVDTKSPYGGVRAVVFLPSALLTRIDAQPAPEPRDPIRSARALGGSGSEASAIAEGPEGTARALTAGGLPKRRRGAPSEQPHVAERSGQNARMPGRPARETAAGMGAWQRGTRSGRANVSPDSEGNPQG
jgi:hypothetical protein